MTMLEWCKKHKTTSKEYEELVYYLAFLRMKTTIKELLRYA